MRDFYFVADWGSKHYLTTPNVMISAGSTYHPKKKKFDLSRTNLPKDTTKKLFLDSGGFSLLSQYPDYPFTLNQYLELAYYIKDNNLLTLIATMDYPCEAEINRTQLHSNEERIQKTIDNTIKCYDVDSSLPWVPVIQGYTIDEYLACIDLYYEVGIESLYWAIGSICSRKGHYLQMRNIIVTIAKRLETECKLHAFGLGVKFLYDPQIFSNIYSSDSAAWNYRAISREQKPQMIEDYLQRITSLQESFAGQEILEVE
jgi:hypothetical protein